MGIATLGMLAGLVACSTSGDSASGTKGYISGAGVVTTVEPSERKPMPDLEGETLTGDELDVADYKGKVIVLNVWASWCPPCRAEIDDLIAAHDALPEAVFVGINANEEDESAAEAFVREHDVPYDSLSDEDGSLMLQFYGLLRPDSLPSTIVIDPQGRLAALVLGQVTESTLVGLVDDIERES